ncbi:Rrf2 family transcriptional regulator [Pseudooceanicola sp. CBS1P-1]|uniref:Rrf2 family transcriptional regulator n=1 Tax=Pseudooceanicola albus TaxID=2692189 RepID=A0A6L7G3S8_9RHOB|nr:MULTISPECIES: Rrf2 family transcriptional regulator [Pseudooceanicola]MBT9385574.1 Rrf2 family transcriptional regulator [Pseudooceanicola endophyticus]MXN19014.1 Rrf2 family transcriptional regulator [Pseudooceanicola albus]
MKLSKFSDYAVRVCLYLGAHQGRQVPISEIVRAHDLSQSNLMKVVNQLVDGGFLSSTRGRRGGVSLARPADQVHLGAVVRHMEGDSQMVDCSTCILLGACGVVRVLAEAKRSFYATLDRFSVADAVGAHPATLTVLLGAGENARTPVPNP